MLDAGFSNLPSEWWHYDFGDQLWAWHTGATATNTISGTSMATPHVAGVAALYLQGNTTATPAAVDAAIKAATTKDKVPTRQTANNDLLFSDY